MSQNEKKGHGGKHTRPKKWYGARRPAGPATTALHMIKCIVQSRQSMSELTHLFIGLM